MLAASSDNTLAYHRTRDQVDNVFLDGTASVIADVFLDGAPVAGGGNIACAYVAGSQGLFRGNLPKTVALISGREYEIRFTITRGAFQRVESIRELCK